MKPIGTIREFNTRRYRVVVEAIEEMSPDFSFDESGETERNVYSGKWVCFTARVRVIHKPSGLVIGEDYLGNCIYGSIAEFENHRQCAREQARIREETGREVVVGSYFSDMIRVAIHSAREYASTPPAFELRNV